MMRTRRTIGITALVAGILAAAWLALSPYWAMSGLRDAVRQRDAATVNRYVDFETLRANLKRRISDQIGAEMAKSRANPMSAAMAQAFITPVIDQMVRPEMVASALAAGNASRSPAGADPETRLVGKDATIRRKSIDRFVLRGEGAAKGGAVFELQGLHWRMVDIDMDNPMTPVTGA